MKNLHKANVLYRVSKDFLPLHFAVGQVPLISGCNLENGRMPCKQQYCIKNMAVKNPDFGFVPLLFTLLT